VTMEARVDAEQRGGVAVATVEGEVDASNADWAGSRLRRLLTNRSHALVVDLSATTHLDSAGIAMLFQLAADMRVHQQELRVVLAGSPVERMVSLTGLHQAAAVYATVDDAVAGARPDAV
jgi:anti-sigma B factor antagonist